MISRLERKEHARGEIRAREREERKRKRRGEKERVEKARKKIN